MTAVSFVAVTARLRFLTIVWMKSLFEPWMKRQLGFVLPCDSSGELGAGKNIGTTSEMEN